MSHPGKNREGGKKEKTPRPREHKKLALKIIVGCVAALIVLAALNRIEFDALYVRLFSPKPLSDTTGKEQISFAVPNYSENIFEDPEYMAQIRDVRYTEGALSTLITDGNYAQYGAALELLHRYLEAVIAGDAEALPSFFTEDYKKDNKLPERFTMQKIYEPEIEFYSKNIINPGKSDQVIRYEYVMRYRIMNNNGTFRDDVGSDAAVPEIYEILEYESTGEVLINSITKIRRVAG
ncbi:MAG: hypothetical protein ACOYID_01910 [Eubacteriales bacterium]|jgi:hypothetical protein|nr:hypothetical protein [Clostridiales bacterium]